MEETPHLEGHSKHEHQVEIFDWELQFPKSQVEDKFSEGRLVLWFLEKGIEERRGRELDSFLLGLRGLVQLLAAGSAEENSSIEFDGGLLLLLVGQGDFDEVGFCLHVAADFLFAV